MARYSGLLVVVTLCVACGDSKPKQQSFECDAPEACDPAATCKKEGGVDVCRCPAGYNDDNGDGTLCTDVDECAAGTDQCDIRASCTNIEGGYVCTCPAGFYGGGRTCTDVDECLSGEHDCTLPEVCRNVPGTWECQCPDGFTGDLCDSCEAGYTSGTDIEGNLTCTPIPIDCVSSPFVCGDGGTCVTDPGGDYCDCTYGHEGHICGRCAPGYQDNDRDGQCKINCFAAEVVCATHMECSDASGAVTCVCAPGYTGVTCDTCTSGWADVYMDGDCHAVTCAAAGLTDCGDNARCFDQVFPPACECDIGYQGADCSICASTHTSDGSGGCVPDLDGSHMLLATGEDELRGTVLGAVDVTTWTWHPLLSLVAPVYGLAYDAGTERLFGLRLDGTDAVYTIDTTDGSMSYFSTISGYHSLESLAFNPTADELYVFGSIGANDYLVVVDATTGSRTTRSMSVTAWGPIGMTWDASSSRILVLENYVSTSGNPPEMYEIDPASPSESSVGTLDPDRSLVSPALAMHPSTWASGPYVAAQRTGTEEEWAEEWCRQAGAAMGYVLQDYVSVASYGNWTPGETVTISSVAGSTMLYAHGDYGDDSADPVTVQIATDNPDDIICLPSYEEVLHVVVQASARFRLLVLATYYPVHTLEVEDGFVPEMASFPPIRAYSSSEPIDPSIDDPDKPVLVYDSSTWWTLGLSSTSYQPTLVQQPVVGTIDWSTGAVTYHVLDGVTFSGGLTAF